MPAFYFNCPEHGVFMKIMNAAVGRATRLYVCPKPCCDRPSKRAPRPPTSSAKEVIDNGLMAKRVERYVDAPELFRERSKRR